jgi:hypothetical protein
MKKTEAKYAMMRILQAPGPWAQAYMDREKTLRGYRSAIIFPEQALELGECGIFTVSVRMNGSTLESSIMRITCGPPRSGDGHKLASLPAILQYEQENADQTGISELKFGSGLGAWGRSMPMAYPFIGPAYFSNAKDAMKYQNKEQLKYVSRL